MRGLRILLLLHFLLLLVAHAAAASDGSEAEGSIAAASSSVDGDDGFDGEAGDSDVDGSSRDTPTMETGQPTLLDLMRAARLERTLINKPRGRKTGISAYINSTQIMAVIVTVIVILYCIRIRTRRYTPDELTLKMSRQARWFKPRYAAYTATDGHIYAVTLDFRGLERVVLPKRYSQQEKENLIGLFERALQYFETVPPDETSGYLIESWSPSEKIPPIDIRIVRLQRNMQAGFALK